MVQTWHAGTCIHVHGMCLNADCAFGIQSLTLTVERGRESVKHASWLCVCLPLSDIRQVNKEAPTPLTSKHYNLALWLHRVTSLLRP